MNKLIKKKYPVVDLFAGPGGLGEGFSSFKCDEGYPFKIKLSIEKNAIAHKTLQLRALYRYFSRENLSIPEEYYQYLAGKIDRNGLFGKYPEASRCAKEEAICAELGVNNKSDNDIDKQIQNALGDEKNWLLIGGPPCQAYSLVGRSRMLGALKDDKGMLIDNGQKFFNDYRHKLYQHYLRIIAKYSPAVFVMENVKGILSSKLGGELIFPIILKDLQNPSKAAKEYNWGRVAQYGYKTISFVTGNEPRRNRDYLIRAEKYGIPQTRHRVIILGVRNDIAKLIDDIELSLVEKEEVHIEDVLKNIPEIRSDFSKRKNTTYEEWKRYLFDVKKQDWFHEVDADVKIAIQNAEQARNKIFLEVRSNKYRSFQIAKIKDWFSDENLKYLSNHESRKHMDSDLYRYLFVSAYGCVKNVSPCLKDFPKELLPKHKNVIKNDDKRNDEQKFADRFKVQLRNKPASTITSHTSKDGHYFIHPDPMQCRSLTVREAARLQTFPDNYFFEGNRTEQYHQVGNAVPPYLAYQLAEIVYRIFQKIKQ